MPVPPRRTQPPPPSRPSGHSSDVADPKRSSSKYSGYGSEGRKMPQRSSSRLSGYSSEGASSSRKATPAADTASPALFPMYVVSIEELLKFKVLPVHEDLAARGLLVEPADDCQGVHFISQRWLGREHPDPEGHKLRRLQEVCRQIVAGDPRELFEAADWECFSQGSNGAMTFAGLARELREDCQELEAGDFSAAVGEGYVWWDYMSVPQRLEKSGTAELQRRAVSSIPHYIERCAYFWVLVPEARHTVSGKTVGYEDWQARGWCRLEEWGNFLARRRAPPLVVTRAKHLGVLDTVDFMSLRGGIGGMAMHAACRGDFTCCELGHRRKVAGGGTVCIRCDKEEITEVLARMHESKVRHYEAAGLQYLHWLTSCSAYSVLAGSGRVRAVESVEELLRITGAEDVNGGEFTRTPLAQAVTYSSPKLVRELLARGARVQDNPILLLLAAQAGDLEVWRLLTRLLPPEKLSEGSAKANITPLDRCARAGHAALCALLLQQRAEVGPVRRDNGHTPLHAAAESGRPEVCRLLLAASAAVDARDARGRTPLLLAAQRLSLFGSSAGKAACARLLLAAGADAALQDGCGRAPLEVAAEDGHAAFLEVYRASQGPRCGRWLCCVHAQAP